MKKNQLKFHKSTIAKLIIITALIVGFAFPNSNRVQAAYYYVWDKYNSNSYNGYNLVPTTGRMESYYDSIPAQVYPGFNFDSHTGAITLTGTPFYLYECYSSDCVGSGFQLTGIYLSSVSNNQNGQFNQYISQPQSGIVYEKGSFISTVTDIQNGKYPYNGRFAIDGYWYVYKGTDNPPTINVVGANNAIISDVNGYNIYSYSGTVSDLDSGTTITIKQKVDNLAEQSIQSLTANGTNQSFGPINATFAPSLLDGIHTLSIWSEDNYGVKSIVTTKNITIDRTPPTIPNVSLSSKSETTVSLAWTTSTDSSGLAGYDIYNGSSLIASTVTQTTYTVSGLHPSTTYNFTVKAKDLVGNISTSNVLSVITPDLTPPTAPSNFIATNITNNSAVLTWSSSSDNVGVVGYDIYNGTSVIASSVTNVTYNVYGLTPSTAYNLSVKAKDAGGNISVSSNVVVVNTLGLSEMDDTYAGANSLTYDLPISSFIGSSTDVDFYKFTSSGQGIDQISLEVPINKNYDVYIYDQNMKPLLAGIKDTGNNEQVLLKVSPGKVYYIKVVGVNGDNSISPYTLTLTRSVINHQTIYEYDNNGNLKTKTTTIVQ